MIKDFKYKISPYKYGIFGFNKATKIQLNEKITEEFFASIVNSLNGEFGASVCVHSYYGLIWNKDGKYISCNIIEEIYGSDFIDIYLFNKIPTGRKLPYKEYESIDGAIKRTFEKLGFYCNALINYNGNGFAYLVENEKLQWLLQIKGKNAACSFSDVSIVDSVTKKISPRYRCKKRISQKNIATIKSAMEQSYSEI